MYEKLLHVWGNELSPREIYEKVRHFTFYYGAPHSPTLFPREKHSLTFFGVIVAINRHKMTTITPA